LLLPIALVALGSAAVLWLQDGAQPESVGELSPLAGLRERGAPITCSDCLGQARAELAGREGDLGFSEALTVALAEEDPMAWSLVVEAGLLTGALTEAEAAAVLEGLERFHPEFDPWRARATLGLAQGRPMSTWAELRRQESGPIERRLETELMVELGRWPEVEELTRARLELAPGDLRATLQLSAALQAQGLPRQAEQVLVSALQSGAADPALIEASAELAWRDGRAEVASRRLSALGESRPEAQAWQALREGRAQDALELAELAEDGELARACALLALDRRNEVIELADGHAGQASWDLLAARAQVGLPGEQQAWDRATAHGTADAWRQRLASQPSSLLVSALAELEAVDPVLALLQRGPEDPAAPGSLLAPASWEEVLERIPAAHAPLVRWWAGMPVTRGPARLRGLSAYERGEGELAWSQLSADPDPVLRALGRSAQGKGSLAQAELVPELDPQDPVHIAVLGLVSAQRQDPRPGARMLSLALTLQPGWRGLYGPRYEAALAAEASAQP
jgi:hypothetical protein